MKSVAALAALVASASAINPARYVRIYDAQNDASDYINLQLVTVFGTSALGNTCEIHDVPSCAPSSFFLKHVGSRCFANGQNYG